MRVGRRLRTVLYAMVAGVSLLLILGCAGMWVISLDDPWVWGWGDCGPGHAFWTFGSGAGRFQLVYDNGVGDPVSWSTWGLAGLEFSRCDAGWNVWVPWWLAIVLLGGIAVWGLRGLWQARKLRDGLCRMCGYDLRATPERCPECGTVVHSTDRSITRQEHSG